MNPTPKTNAPRRLPVTWQACGWCPELCVCQAIGISPQHCQVRRIGFVGACPKPGPQPVRIQQRSR